MPIVEINDIDLCYEVRLGCERPHSKGAEGDGQGTFR